MAIKRESPPDLRWISYTTYSLDLPFFRGYFQAQNRIKKIGKAMLQFVKKGDLVLRDMGYFAHAMFIEIERLRAFWLSWLTANVNVSLLDGSSLEKKLRSRSNTMLDEIVIVGAEGLRCRLVAMRADDDLATKCDSKIKSKTQQYYLAIERANRHNREFGTILVSCASPIAANGSKHLAFISDQC